MKKICVLSLFGMLALHCAYSVWYFTNLLLTIFEICESQNKVFEWSFPHVLMLANIIFCILCFILLIVLFLLKLKGSNFLNFTRLTYEEYKELREKKKQEEQAKKRLQLEEKLKELQNVESNPKSTKG